MTVASTEFYFPPVPQLNYLDRLAVVPSRLDSRGFWTEVHHDVQEQLAVLESDVRQSVAGVRVTSGITRGEHFLLFSYLTFSLPDSDIDPVVVGMTFTQADEGVDVEADVSGEQTGDLISSAPNRMVPDSRSELLAAARDSARELRQSAKAIAAALKNPSRRVE
jgi:hypothetical protein